MNFINSSGNRRIEEHTHLSRRSIIKLLIVSILNMGLWINACNFSDIGKDPTAKPEKENNMETLKSNSNPVSKIPPIDAAQPASTETATFALG